MSKIHCVVACTTSGLIGDSTTNKIPWHCPADMKHFKNLTVGQTVVMGKNTYFSLPDKFRPLPNRNNVVLTSDQDAAFQIEREGGLAVQVSDTQDMCEFLRTLSSTQDIYIIGGGQLYQAAFGCVDVFHVSIISDSIVTEKNGDIFFPISRLVGNPMYNVKHIESNTKDVVFVTFEKERKIGQ